MIVQRVLAPANLRSMESIYQWFLGNLGIEDFFISSINASHYHARDEAV
jgi:hypothetical protein